MKTQCPKCQQINEVPGGFKGRMVTCSFCEHVFSAGSLVKGMPAKGDPGDKPNRKPGDTWYTVAILAGLLGGMYFIAAIMGPNPGGSLIILVSTILLCMLAITLGRIIDRLEEISGQIEQLGRDIKHNKSG